jgi:hypothetical protein
MDDREMFMITRVERSARHKGQVQAYNYLRYAHKFCRRVSSKRIAVLRNVNDRNKHKNKSS